jgi:hypothetical protein
MRIDRLTAAQETGLAEVRAEWEAVGLATEPADRPRAERAIRAAYVAAGLPPPTVVLWARSPLEAVLGMTHMAVLGEGSRRERLAAVLEVAYGELVGWPGGDAWGRLWAPFFAPSGDPLAAFLARTYIDSGGVRAAVATRVLRQADAAVRDRLAPRLRNQLRRELRDDVRERVAHDVWAPMVAEIQGRAWPRLKALLEARHSARWSWLRSWAVVRDLYGVISMQDALHGPMRDQASLDCLALYDFLSRTFGLEESAALNGLTELARSAGWWWPHRSAVIVCERPVRLFQDDRGRLHGESGPAIVYPDGWSIWAWHGVRVPRRVIEQPEALPASEVLAEPDPEVRRVMIERLGNDRFLRDAGATRVAEDETGVLWRVDLPDDEPLLCIEVTNASPAPDATFRRYVLRVPPDMRTPREAVAWTFALDSRDYWPSIET